jgi:hypothetical protein
MFTSSLNTMVCSELEPQHREPTSAGAGDLLRRSEACVDNAGGSITVQTAVGPGKLSGRMIYHQRRVHRLHQLVHQPTINDGEQGATPYVRIPLR